MEDVLRAYLWRRNWERHVEQMRIETDQKHVLRRNFGVSSAEKFIVANRKYISNSIERGG